VALEVLVAMARSPRRPTIVAVLPRDSAADARVAGLAKREVIRAPTTGPEHRARCGSSMRRCRASCARRGSTSHVGGSFVLRCAIRARRRW